MRVWTLKMDRDDVIAVVTRITQFTQGTHHMMMTSLELSWWELDSRLWASANGSTLQARLMSSSSSNTTHSEPAWPAWAQHLKCVCVCAWVPPHTVVPHAMGMPDMHAHQDIRGYLESPTVQRLPSPGMLPCCHPCGCLRWHAMGG